jgi:NAD(P)H-hydrate epimerase
VLTPHPGELARLLGTSVDTLQENRWGAAEQAAQALGSVVVFKGHGTLVAEPGGRVAHIPTGNTSLSRGGSGDLLAGVIVGLLAQGCAPWEAGVLGAFVCGLAADLLATDQSPRGVTVREVAAFLPRAWRALETEARHQPATSL